MAEATREPDATGNTLSWPSAFWALVGIAANTMTQPSGMIVGCPSRLNLALRSSPIVCIANALGSLVVLGLAARATTLGHALQAIKKSRFADVDVDAGNNSFKDFRSNVFVRIIMFGIGLTQIIKLYATSGIPWVQFSASAYLASYLVDEVILLAAGCLAVEDPSNDGFTVSTAASIPGSLLRFFANDGSGESLIETEAPALGVPKATKFRTAGTRLWLYWGSSLAFSFFLSMVFDDPVVTEGRRRAMMLGLIIGVFAFVRVILALAPAVKTDSIVYRRSRNATYSTAMSAVSATLVLAVGVRLGSPVVVAVGVIFNVIPSTLMASEPGMPPFIFGGGFLVLHSLVFVIYFPFLR